MCLSGDWRYRQDLRRAVVLGPLDRLGESYNCGHFEQGTQGQFYLKSVAEAGQHLCGLERMAVSERSAPGGDDGDGIGISLSLGSNELINA
jgi:hypothetical protein